MKDPVWPWFNRSLVESKHMAKGKAALQKSRHGKDGFGRALPRRWSTAAVEQQHGSLSQRGKRIHYIAS